jgi:hypothetical protein
MAQAVRAWSAAATPGGEQRMPGAPAGRPPAIQVGSGWGRPSLTVSAAV